MPAQPAIFDPIPLHARHLFFDLEPGADCRSALHALAAQCDGHSAVLGIGQEVTQALGVQLEGLRGFPVLPDARLRFRRHNMHSGCGCAAMSQAICCCAAMPYRRWLHPPSN